jgi:hypothetical protein
VPTTLADPPTAPAAEQASAAGQPAAQQEPGAAAAPQRSCANCGAPMDGAQDWCLQCGRGAPGSLQTHAAGWRSGATALIATAILALGAAAAAYAALSKENGKPRVVRTTVAQSATPPAASTPGGAPVPGAAATPPSSLGTPTTVKPVLPTTAVKPPKIPLTTPTPKATVTTPTATSLNGSTNPATSPGGSGGSSATGETHPAAILLDTNAAVTYNPYGYPASDFGDPSLAIDGETATGWTAQLEPAVAPKMAEGLVIDLKSPHRLSALVIATSTPGMTIQIYGANGHTLPGSITDHAWVKLSPNLVDKAKHLRLKLRESKKAFRFVTLWISKAPASSVGNAQAPGHVSVNELELFPAS